MHNGVNCWKPVAVSPTAMVISSLAVHVSEPSSPRGTEGSETRSRAKAVMDPRAPRIFDREDGDIVRYSVETRRSGLNSQCNKCYGSPVVYSPGRGVVYKNVGRAPGSSGLDNAALNSLSH